MEDEKYSSTDLLRFKTARLQVVGARVNDDGGRSAGGEVEEHAVGKIKNRKDIMTYDVQLR